MIDKIVFSQEQLDEAIREGAVRIVLCDNSFNIPPVGGKAYTALGEVEAKALFCASFAKEHGIVFNGTKPVFDVPTYAHVPQKSMSVGGSYGSYSSYGSYGSYGSGSFAKNVSSYRFISSSARTSGIFVGGYGIDLI